MCIHIFLKCVSIFPSIRENQNKVEIQIRIQVLRNNTRKQYKWCTSSCTLNYCQVSSIDNKCFTKYGWISHWEKVSLASEKKMFTGFPKVKVQNSRVFLYFPKTLKELVMYKLCTDLGNSELLEAGPSVYLIHMPFYHQELISAPIAWLLSLMWRYHLFS